MLMMLIDIYTYLKFGHCCNYYFIWMTNQSSSPLTASCLPAGQAEPMISAHLEVGRDQTTGLLGAGACDSEPRNNHHNVLLAYWMIGLLLLLLLLLLVSFPRCVPILKSGNR